MDKQKYIKDRLQFIGIDHNGVIKTSDQTLLTMEIGSSIADVHPFFESFSSLVDAEEQELDFNCVHLNDKHREYITDIKMIKNLEGIFIILHDLTQHYTTYQEVAQARNESIIKSELIILKNLELEERERFKNSFIQNFSHELRNPLTSILSMTKLLSETALTLEQKNMLEFLNESNLNLKMMLEDILSISMIGSGKLVLQEKMFNFHSLMELVSFTYQTKAKAKGLFFDYTLDDKIPAFVEGDRLRLFQVLTNLLDNAIKFTQEGSIQLTIQCNQKRANKISLRFSITDTGIGIPKESITAIFESFTQLATDEKYNGSGLGLSIVKGLLELMGSEIKVMSPLRGGGSEFYFDLLLKFPIHTGSPTATRASVLEKRGSLTLKNNKKYKLLLVEDDERVLAVLFKILLATDLFYIDLISDGAKVMETVIQSNYDLIIMDVNLPNTSGDQITKLIRDFPFKNIKQIPIIGLTAYAFEEHIQTYREAGMNEVITKPFEHDHLLATITKVLK